MLSRGAFFEKKSPVPIVSVACHFAVSEIICTASSLTR